MRIKIKVSVLRKMAEFKWGLDYHRIFKINNFLMIKGLKLSNEWERINERIKEKERKLRFEE